MRFLYLLEVEEWGPGIGMMLLPRVPGARWEILRLDTVSDPLVMLAELYGATDAQRNGVRAWLEGFAEASRNDGWNETE